MNGLLYIHHAYTVVLCMYAVMHLALMHVHHHLQYAKNLLKGESLSQLQQMSSYQLRTELHG